MLAILYLGNLHAGDLCYYYILKQDFTILVEIRVILQSCVFDFGLPNILLGILVMITSIRSLHLFFFTTETITV